MKNVIKSVLIVSFIIFSISTTTNAQSKLKLGHVDSEEILKSMPERDSALAKLKDYSKSLETQFQSMQSELETKYNDFMANQSTYSDLIKQMKQKELEDLQKRIQDFQQSAQEDVQKKEQELLKPIIDKAKKAIEEVAKENGYTYVFDRSLQVLLYSDPNDDITPLVKKKLGVK